MTSIERVQTIVEFISRIRSRGPDVGIPEGQPTCKSLQINAFRYRGGLALHLL